MHNERQQRKDLESLANEFGVILEIKHTHKGHVKVTFRAGTKAAALVMARGHGGDPRGRMNNLARTRRQLRELVHE